MRTAGTKVQPVAVTAAILLAVAYPALSGNGYYVEVATDIGIAVILALGLSLLYGYAGQISFAQGAFYGIGAYTSVLLVADAGVPWVLAFVAGAVLPALLALVVGVPTLRLHGHYLAIATLALQIGISEVFVNARGLTGGNVGLFDIERPTIAGIDFSDDVAYYLLVAAIAMVTFLVARRLVVSRFGRGLLFIREDEVAAATIGISPRRDKLVVFVLSAGLAGLAGVLYAFKIQFINPATFSINQSILVLSMVVIGGLGSNWGAVTGAVVVTIITQALFSVGDLSFLIYGAWIVAVMVLFPGGIAGLARLGVDTLRRVSRAPNRERRPEVASDAG
jgi:branched-chain amino acid transport system permease protein